MVESPGIFNIFPLNQVCDLSVFISHIQMMNIARRILGFYLQWLHKTYPHASPKSYDPFRIPPVNLTKYKYMALCLIRTCSEVISILIFWKYSHQLYWIGPEVQMNIVCLQCRLTQSQGSHFKVEFKRCRLKCHLTQWYVCLSNTTHNSYLRNWAILTTKAPAPGCSTFPEEQSHSQLITQVS